MKSLTVGVAGGETDIMRNVYPLGIRHVKPYITQVYCYAKQRWIGKRLIDVFLTEFRANPEEYTVSRHVTACVHQ